MFGGASREMQGRRAWDSRIGPALLSREEQEDANRSKVMARKQTQNKAREAMMATRERKSAVASEIRRANQETRQSVAATEGSSLEAAQRRILHEKSVPTMKFSFRPAARDTGARRPSFEGGLRTAPAEDARPQWNPSGSRTRVPSPRRLSAEIAENREFEKDLTRLRDQEAQINRAKVLARKAAANNAKAAVQMARERKRAMRYDDDDM
jgi:hypothetical protein